MTATRILETTRTIAAQLGARFGFRYRVQGHAARRLRAPADGVEIPLHRESSAAIQRILSRPRSSTSMRPSNDNYVITMSLESPSDLVAGTWTLEIWSGDKKLTEQTSKSSHP